MNKNWDRPSRKFFQNFTYIINFFLKTVDDFILKRRCYLHIDVFLVGSKREQLKQFIDGLSCWILFQILDQFIKFFSHLF